MNKPITHCITGLFSLVLLLPLQAMAEGPLDSRIEQWLVVLDEEKGGEVFQEIDTVEPGQVIEYHLIYTNRSDNELMNLRINGPVPNNTGYVPDSARTKVPTQMVVSIDGGESYETEPVKRKRRQADGQVAEIEVPPDEYTHLSWVADAPMPGGTTWTFAYRVKVE